MIINRICIKKQSADKLEKIIFSIVVKFSIMRDKFDYYWKRAGLLA